MYLPTFTSSCGPNSPLEWAWSPLDFDDSSFHITAIPTSVACLSLPLNPNAPLSFVVFAIPSNVPSSSIAPSNVTILGLDDSFVDPNLQDYQLHDVVPFNVYHLSVSKFDVTNDPLSKKQKCSEGKSWKKSYDSTRKFQTEWATKVPWAEGVVSKNGMINLVKSKMYFL